MECFCDEYFTVCKKKVYLCGFCGDGESNNTKKIYKSAIEKADFADLKDDYYIDIKLYELISQVTPKNVLAMGIGIIIKDSIHIGGGIIGNPLYDGESADDELEYIQNNLWCIAFSGRYGAVFYCDNEKDAVKHAEHIKEFNKNDIKYAIYATRDYLKGVTDRFLILADGSGYGAYPYCACCLNEKIMELDFGLNN